jgi:hypothetical protein
VALAHLREAEAGFLSGLLNRARPERYTRKSSSRRFLLLDTLIWNVQVPFATVDTVEQNSSLDSCAAVETAVSELENVEKCRGRSAD